MSKFQFFTLLVLALAAIVLATPVDKRSVNCKPIGKPTKLVSYNPEYKTTHYFKTADDSAHPRLVVANSSTEQFQFYQCSLPSDRYRKERSGKIFGQLRSTKHSGQCLTPNNNQVQTPDTGDGWINTKPIPANTDGTITLQSCATSDTEVMRRQWLALENYGSTEPCSFPYIKQEGRKGDFVLGGLDGDSKSSAFYFPFKSATSTAYFHDKLPASCKSKL